MPEGQHRATAKLAEPGELQILPMRATRWSFCDRSWPDTMRQRSQWSQPSEAGMLGQQYRHG